LQHQRRLPPCCPTFDLFFHYRAHRRLLEKVTPEQEITGSLHPELEAMLATCDDSLEGLRDRALLCFGFASGGRRRSEIAAADMRDLRKVGDDGYIYRLEFSKTQQSGVTQDSTPDKPILGRSAEALAAWIEAAGIQEGAIFRRLWKEQVGPALLPGSVATIVKRRARLAGLEGDFGAHSLRSGFVTEAGRQGVPLPAVMAMTEHRSVASVIGYFQTGAAEDNPAARLLK
ncbi:site-specific integrase, partial [Stenotrophomonas acidaminiphila]|uniref:site-specific integrase n=1 Tax=Stenotrophomonas acidaminiphila TaxID=128780 RepID=UPI0024049D6A